MARWVWAVVAVLCVAGMAAEPRSSLRSHSRSEHRPSRLSRSRQGSHRWRSRRPSVPEPEHYAREDAAAQMQRLWNQWMNGTQSDQPQPKLPVFVLKQQLATRDGVNQLRKLGPKQAFKNFDIMNDAAFNGEDMTVIMERYTELQSYTCKEPTSQLVRVSSVHLSTSAVYLPHSVLLHRCSDHTSCCRFDYQSCVSVANTTITQPVLVINVAGDRKKTIKNLSFVEDTECKCMKTEATWRTSGECPQNLPVNDESDSVGPRRGKKDSRRKRGRKAKKSAQQTCRCTSEFASRSMPNGSCKCDCFDSNRKCKKQRRGSVFLSEADNRCIVRGTCQPPHCKHGKYEQTRSRCPRRRGEWRRNRFTV